MTQLSFRAARIFDGTAFCDGALRVEGGRVAGFGPADGKTVDLGEGMIVPGMIDLQVNGAGGIAVDGATDADALAGICATMARLGATGCLPTLITDTTDATARVLTAGADAARRGVAGFLGLHLEGPHLDPRRAGAHDPALIRPMTEGDLSRLTAARPRLPALMVTVAPEAVTPAQIARLTEAGIVVSLGHSDCDAATARRAMQAGARCATHLFNAMSQMTSRAPGLAGAVLDGDGFAGLIADGLHVDPVTLRVALAAKGEGIFLVSDCMALAGTDRTDMRLGGRLIRRGGGRLTLADGTLAGADLTLPQAVATLAAIGIAETRALAMATSIPARVIGRHDIGTLRAGARADFLHLGPDGGLRGVWRGGVALA
ncbi:MAG: N-acetylglucosamine-6-phosphate deacetylase [Pseudomonadota bacterium]